MTVYAIFNTKDDGFYVDGTEEQLIESMHPSKMELRAEQEKYRRLLIESYDESVKDINSLLKRLNEHGTGNYYAQVIVMKWSDRNEKK